MKNPAMKNPAMKNFAMNLAKCELIPDGVSVHQEEGERRAAMPVVKQLAYSPL